MRNKIILSLITLVMATFSSYAYYWEDINFDGKVGKYPVMGSLYIGSVGEVSGSYGYKKNGQKPKAWLELDGEYDAISSTKYKITMREYSNGRVTGTWNIVYDSRKRTITGKMTTNGKTYDVVMRVTNRLTYSPTR